MAAAALYARAEPVRSFLNVLTPAPLVFLLLFLLGSPVSKLAFPDEAGARTVGGVTQAPIVVVLLDELPSNTLVDEQDRLDTKRYPGFAELARNATWFKNAYTVYDSTERAQPAIMDGDLPPKDRLPISADHPNSIFSLFAKTHRLNVSEEATSVCSRDLCKDERADEPYGDRISSMTEDLGLVWLHVVSPPGIEDDLHVGLRELGRLRRRAAAAVRGRSGGSGKSANTRANLNSAGAGRASRSGSPTIRKTRRPALNFKHTLMPHVPWQFLPDGRRYRRRRTTPIPGMSNQSYNDQGQLDVLDPAPLPPDRLRRPPAAGALAPPEARGHVGRLADRRGRRPRRRVHQGPARPPPARRRELRRDRPDPALHQGAGAEEGQGERRLRRDDRHPADDLRHPEHRRRR